MSSKHEFAVYVPFLREKILKTNQTIMIDEENFLMRVNSVLRLRPDEQITLFDELIHASSTIIEMSKKNIQLKVLTKENNRVLQPKITFILPILKKEDFEQSLYSLVELGANAVQFVTTEKIQRSMYGEKEFERCKRIMIAAAEQSKNFMVPELFLPVSLQEYIKRLDSVKAPKIYFDVDGKALLSVSQEVQNQKPQELILMVGPEGDLTEQEKNLLKSHQFIFCSLTPTVLRSVTALQLGLGLFRTLFK